MKQEFKEKIKRFGKKAGIAVLATGLFLICSGVLYLSKVPWRGQKASDRVEQSQEAAVQQGQSGGKDEYWSIAVFGVDSRSNTVGRGTSADAQFICSINKTTGEIKLVSVYRDTFLRIGNEYGKLDSAYDKGSAEQNLKALNENLDLNISDYVSLSFKAAADIVNQLGGIDLEITQAEWEYINSFITETVNVTGIPSTQLAGPGMQHLDGVQAVAYARLRLMDSDQNRTERQRKVVKLVWDKLKKEGSFADGLQILIKTIPELGTNLSIKDITAFAADGNRYKIVDSTGFPFDYTEAQIGNRGNCIIPNTLETNVEKLHGFLYGDETYRCPDTVKEINREILKQAVKN